MGILSFRQFSSIPNLFRKIKFRTQQRERVEARIPTDFTSFIVNNGTRIVRSGNTDGAQDTLIYTVPTGKRFYLYSASISAAVAVTLLRIGSLFINTDAETFLSIVLRDLVGANQTSTVVYTVPLLISAGEVIIARGSDASFSTSSSIVGYELDEKSEKQRF